MPSARKDEATLTAGKFKDLREDLADRVGEEVVAAAEKDAAAVVVEVPEVDLTGGKGGPVYVVQVLQDLHVTEDTMYEPVGAWVDVVAVRALARSKRRTIIEAALRSDAGKQLTLPARVRVLDVDAAREHPVGLREREPELVIG
jgi:hypothetical protein